MAKKSEQLTLDELRDKSVQSKTKLSFGKEMNGYSKKQVTEYIDNLSENLRSAEESFNSRLDEYAAMIAMLKQERDQYGEMYNLCKSSKSDMSDQLDELKKENEALNQLINERRVDDTATPIAELITAASETETQNKLNEYLIYEQESVELKAQLHQLKAMVKDLNDELNSYARENLIDAGSGLSAGGQTQPDSRVLESQYQDILKERSALLAEKTHLLEENKTLVSQMTDLQEQLDRFDLNCKTQIEAALSIYKSNADQYIKSHREMRMQLTNNLKNSLALIDSDDDSLLNLTAEER